MSNVHLFPEAPEGRRIETPHAAIPAYAELAVTTNFSFLRGGSHPEELVARARELGLAGLGIADRNSVAGVVRAHMAARDPSRLPPITSGVAPHPSRLAHPKGDALAPQDEEGPQQPIKIAVGARLVFADGTPDVLAYPQDRAAWGRLTRLLTVGKSRAEKGDCILFFDDLIEHGCGLNLIVMPPRRLDAGRLAALLGRLKTCFGEVEHSGAANSVRSLSPRASTPAPQTLARMGEGWGEGPFVDRLTRPLTPPRHSASKMRVNALMDARRPSPTRGEGNGARRLAVWLAASMLYRGDDHRRLARLAALAGEAGVPLIAVNDVLYHAPERRPLQDVLTCIREYITIDAAGRRLEANAERHLKLARDMARLFRRAPEAIAETIRFFDRCRFSLEELRKTEYPDERRPPYATPQEALAALAEEGARRRYPNGMREDIRRALDHELAVTAELKYAPYFLTVYDIVQYARRNGILCQGRGSAANSVICYCLDITEVDPERIDLLFERFVSAERREPPDIDVDFEHERREEVIQFIYRHYGRDHAGLAATVICYRGRSAIREVGKVFGLSEDTISALAGTLWGWSKDGVTRKEARRAGFDPGDPRLQKTIALAQALIGFPRHLSQHVGGFVITRSRLDEVVAVENAAMDDRTVIEWDKDDLNDLDLLKVDVLGLGMLTCLRRSFDLLKAHYVRPSLYASANSGAAILIGATRSTSPRLRGEHRRPSAAVLSAKDADANASAMSRSASGEGQPSYTQCVEEAPHPDPLPASGEREPIPLDLASIQDYDAAVYDMLSRADSVGVFQVESRAQMSMLPRLRPKEFYDLVIEVAIVRPGPIQGDMVHPYLQRREKLRDKGEEPTYPSPAPEHGDADELKQVLHKTLGVPLFQEQAMRIAIVAAKFPPTKADRLRRAMATFKRVGTIDRFRAEFVAGMVARGYPRDFATRCFGQIEGFGEYGFPESHAASFAILVYASAWIKCRYPEVFAAALLNSQPMGFYAPAQIVRDAQEHGVEMRPVDVNLSDWDATLEEGPPARDRLNVRHASMRDCIRSTHAVRLGLRQVSGFQQAHALKIESVRGRGFDSVRDLWLRTRLPPSALERLAEADAFGSLGLSRRDALWAVRALARAGDKDNLPLFARVKMPELEPDANLPPMLPGEQVVEDYRHLHLSLKAHPLSFIRDELTRRGILRHEALAAIPSGQRVTVAGLVLVRQRPGDAKAIFMTLEDETGVANTILWLRTFEAYRPVVLGARLISVTGELQNESGVIHVVARHLEDLSPLLRKLSEEHYACVETLSRCDASKNSEPGNRSPKRMAERRAWAAREVAGVGDTTIAAVMPKGRNFH
jgi:error-prone DNA polymerase